MKATKLSVNISAIKAVELSGDTSTENSSSVRDESRAVKLLDS